MKQIKKLSDTEMELMEVIWACDPPVTSSELLRIFLKRDKTWKAQTISTFLSRLVDKGLLKATRIGRTNHYAPCLSQKAYKLWETENVLDALYEGSVKNMISALYDGDKLSDEDISELKQWFSGK
ncbi:BlaI/MecI/CopY family transcriptional regulator [Halalkalibacter oceani]|uniref:BlaI/MecI/CopY family transcriptional regulator n=1 Tax=Halalkalibacter oceani TaxID=1653776 RepID=A0A9X2DWH5_9BACI|nr:BlaI/MecI/CopY family transcriptional regulator [Halalkalibacter oceani]MCM3716665.1 BlaI/MecI/CopY family transcriptional regulator [Halalkalibacter oceani]MCM3759867.1 BlaI/MecI/CopY family transcriptional regulator [Halalkalibacter oceani]